MFTRLGVERAGPQSANDFDAGVEEVRETVHVVDDQNIDTVKGIYDSQEGVSDGAQVNPDPLVTLS